VSRWVSNGRTDGKHRRRMIWGSSQRPSTVRAGRPERCRPDGGSWRRRAGLRPRTATGAVVVPAAMDAPGGYISCIAPPAPGLAAHTSPAKLRPGRLIPRYRQRALLDGAKRRMHQVHCITPGRDEGPARSRRPTEQRSAGERRVADRSRYMCGVRRANGSIARWPTVRLDGGMAVLR
jgi:hypothetical protein